MFSRIKTWFVPLFTLLAVVGLGVFLTFNGPTADLDSRSNNSNSIHANAAEDEAKEMSFYKLASAGSVLFNKELAPQADEAKGLGQFQSQSNAGVTGGLLGFGDGNKTKGLTGFFNSLLSSSSASMSYDSIGAVENKAQGSNNLKTQGYIYLGASLKDLGLDSTDTDGGLGFGRYLVGIPVILVFLLSYLVTVFFTVTATILKWFNPFALFYTAATMLVPSTSGFLGGESMPGWMNSIAPLFTNLYLGMKDIGLYFTIPVSVALMLAGVLLFKKSPGGEGAWGRLKKIILRLLFIFFGIPILGSTYTMSLDMMSSYSANNPAGDLINKTFIDFKAWAQDNRLDLAGHRISYDVGEGAAKGDTINMTTSITGDVNNRTGKNMGELSTVMSTMMRYMSSEKYYASDFETYVKSKMIGDKDIGEKFKKYKDADGIRDIEDLNNDPFFGTFGGGLYFDGDQVWNTGGKFDSKDSRVTMSAIAMYNYLSTKFDKTNLVVFSNEKASSGLVREHHLSVNLVGSGFQSFFIWLDLIMSMLVLIVIGFYYAIGILINNISRMMQIVLAVPFAAVGMLSQIAKVVGYTAVMIAEVLISMLVYSVAVSVIMDFNNILTGVVRPLVDTIPVVGHIISILLIIIKVILLFWFTAKAIRIRGHIVKAFSDATTQVIDKFFLGTNGGSSGVDTGSRTPGAGTVAGLGAGLATAAGLGAGSKLMNGARKATGGVGGQSDGTIRGIATGTGGKGDPSGAGGPGDPNDPNNPGGGGIHGVDGAQGELGGGTPLLTSSGDGPDNDKDERELGTGVLSKDSLGEGEKPTVGDKVDAAKTKAEATKDAVSGVRKLAQGGAKVAGAVSTGNAAVGLSGAKDIVSGAKDIKGAMDKNSEANQKLDGARNDSPGGRSSGANVTSFPSATYHSGTGNISYDGKSESFNRDNVVGKTSEGAPVYRTNDGQLIQIDKATASMTADGRTPPPPGGTPFDLPSSLPTINPGGGTSGSSPSVVTGDSSGGTTGVASRGVSSNGDSTTINANSTSNASDNSMNTTAGGKQTLGGKVAGAVSKATSLATAGQSALGTKGATNQSKVVNNASTNLGATNSRTTNDISAGVGAILTGKSGEYNQNNVKQSLNEKVSNSNTKVNRGGAVATSTGLARTQQQKQQQRVQTQQSRQQSNARVTAKTLGTKVRSAAGGYRQQKSQRQLKTVRSVQTKPEVRNVTNKVHSTKQQGVKMNTKKEDSGDWI